MRGNLHAWNRRFQESADYSASQKRKQCFCGAAKKSGLKIRAKKTGLRRGPLDCCLRCHDLMVALRIITSDLAAVFCSLVDWLVVLSERVTVSYTHLRAHETRHDL